MAAALDGSFWALFATYGAMGLDAGYSLNTLSVFTLTGRSYVARAMDSCVLDAPDFAYTSSRYLTVEGRSMTQYLATAPWSAAVAAQRLGGVKPSMPVYVAHSMFDDTIPYAIGKQLAKDWCATGANVVFSTNYALSHVLGEGPAASEGISFLRSGSPAPRRPPTAARSERTPQGVRPRPTGPGRAPAWCRGDLRPARRPARP